MRTQQDTTLLSAGFLVKLCQLINSILGNKQMQEKIAVFLALGILSGLTFGLNTQNIKPESARDIAYPTVIVLKIISKR